ncbi:pilus assembly protein CpaF [Variovorax sp. OK605]|uniref:ATPase, T2SS/T4P/T4SS family n=1 Tax=Variovorax sp. OK605 TaxID=1855317 RepID=UPI0008E3B698|nr:ATPase, T2SS/T4P/T4SS family [Variovorax sp. OK605]SFP08090.1 pilus assembly protein CpaF [Variovorax sp. OK605]
MHKVFVNSPQQAVREVPIDIAELQVGKDSGSHIVLSGWNVAKLHAQFVLHDEEVFVQDLGSLFGTWVDGNRVTRFGPMKGGEEIIIGGHTLVVSLDTALRPAGTEPQDAADATQMAETSLAIEDPLLQWRRSLHRTLLQQLDNRRIDTAQMKDEELRSNIRALISEIIRDTRDMPAELDRALLSQQLLDEAIGLGPLEVLLKDESVTEVMVNRFDEIWIERAGRLERTNVAFTSNIAVLGAIERIVTPLGRRIDESSPMVDARLKDGSRVNAIIPPLALRGPSVTIRKFPKNRMGHEGMIRTGSITAQMVEFMRIAVEEKLNIIVSGGTGTGKTTLLNMVSNFIPPNERIVTIEDAAELSLGQPNLVSLESRPANIEGKGAIAIRDLVRNSLRMRPDRIVVGECRGGEALDMLQAMNTGHDGSLTTLHSNSPRDAMSRLEVLVTMAGMNIPVAAIREQIASAVDLIVQLTRFPCGSRKVTQITEITGFADGVIQMQDVYAFRKTGVDDTFKTVGHFTAAGTVPEFFTRLQEHGLKLDLEYLFGETVP